MIASDVVRGGLASRGENAYKSSYSDDQGDHLAQFDAEVRRVLQQSFETSDEARRSVSNIFITRMATNRGNRRFRLIGSLRATIETHDDKEFLAFLVGEPWNRSFVGYGESRQEALEDLLDTVWDDYFFYIETPDDGLTSDAIGVKRSLVELIHEVGTDQ